jgi:hypothetical protein
MVTAIRTQHHVQSAPIIGITAVPHHLPDLFPDSPVVLTFSEFDFSLTAPLIERSSTAGSRQRTIRAEADNDVLIVCRLKGTPIAGSQKLRSEELTVDFELKSSRPRARFVAASLQALLGLSHTVRLRIPDLEFDASLRFSVPLEQVGKLRLNRWISYQLMVIERAFGLEINEPPELTRAEQEQIAFVYRAIVERTSWIRMCLAIGVGNRPIRFR